MMAESSGEAVADSMLAATPLDHGIGEGVLSLRPIESDYRDAVALVIEGRRLKI